MEKNKIIGKILYMASIIFGGFSVVLAVDGHIGFSIFAFVCMTFTAFLEEGFKD